MTEKQKRHQEILDLIASRPIGTQEALSEALSEVGISTTQSTLSKDMRELRIAKVPDGNEGFRYQAPGPGRLLLQGANLLERELSDFVMGLDGAENMLVVKTITGHAQGVCEAIDQSGWTEIVGTIAGENTIFVLCRSTAAREELKARVLGITGALPGIGLQEMNRNG